jgi:hypothetical protein
MMHHITDENTATAVAVDKTTYFSYREPQIEPSIRFIIKNWSLGSIVLAGLSRCYSTVIDVKGERKRAVHMR